MSLTYRTREASGPPDGALVLLHGRGADENDLFPLFDMLDPKRRLVGIAPRGPLALPPGGAHWYQVLQVGFPDPDTFHPTFERLAPWFDSVLEELGVPMERTVIGGFSQGAVMSYSLMLGAGRPRPAGLIALSGFIPTVEGFEIDPMQASGLPVAIGHGTLDPVIEVGWGRRAREVLEPAEADLLYRESRMDHTIDPAFLRDLAGWLEKVVPPSAS